MNTLFLILSVLAIVGLFIALVVGAVSIWNVIPATDNTKKTSFAVVAILVLSVFAGGIGYVVFNGYEKSNSPGMTVAPMFTTSLAPAQPTPHEAAVQKQIEQELRDVHGRQMALSDAQAAMTKADRAHIEKQREQELKAQKRDSQLAAFQRFTEQSAKTAENGLKLLEKISKQPAPVVNVTNYTTVQVPTTTNIVNVAPSTATITVQAPAVTNIVYVSPAANPPVTIQNVVTNVTVVQPTPVTFTITNVTSGTLTSALTTQVVVAPKPAPAPTKTNAPPAPQAPVKVKASKAPAAPAVAPTNTPPAKASVAKAPAAKVGRGVVTHTENPVKISRGAKDWRVVNLFTGTPETIQRKFTLEYTRGNVEDQALAQKAIDLFVAHQAKELRKEASPKNLLGMFTEFVNKSSGLKLGDILKMNPVITSEILPGGTPGT